MNNNEIQEKNPQGNEAKDLGKGAVAAVVIATKAAAGNYIGAAKTAIQNKGAVSKLLGFIVSIILIFVVFISSMPQMIFGGFREGNDFMNNINGIFDEKTVIQAVAKEYSDNWDKFAHAYQKYLYGKIEFILNTHLLKEPYSVTEYGNNVIEYPDAALKSRELAAASENGVGVWRKDDYEYTCVIEGENDYAIATVTEHYYDSEMLAVQQKMREQGYKEEDLPPADYDTDGCYVELSGEAIITPFDMILISSAWTLSITATVEDAINIEWNAKVYDQFYKWLDYWSFHILGVALEEAPNVPIIEGSSASFPWLTTSRLVELMKLPKEKADYLESIYISSYGVLDGFLSNYHLYCQKTGIDDLLRHELNDPFNYCANAYGYSDYFNVKYISFLRDLPYDISQNQLQEDLEGIFNPSTDFLFDGMPMDVAYISSSYGMRILWGQRRFHYGIDMVATAAHGPIFAVEDGVIVTASIGLASRGTTVVIRHFNPKDSEGNRKYKQYNSDYYYTTYQHLSKITVSVGQTVKSGTQIGNQGGGGRTCPVADCRTGSGDTTGHHLHFAVSKNNPVVTGDKGAEYYSPIFRQSK